MLAFLLGCGLRRGEVLALAMRSIQLREEHWVIADLIGKGGHIRTIPIPVWVKGALNDWIKASGITEGSIFRSIKGRSYLGNWHDTEGALGGGQAGGEGG